MSFDIFVLKFVFEFLIISLSDPFISVTIATYILVWLQRLNFVYKQELVKKQGGDFNVLFFPTLDSIQGLMCTIKFTVFINES